MTSLPSSGRPGPPMTLTQKILAHHAIGLARPWVEAGDVLRISVDWTLASELAWNGMERTYQSLGRPPLKRRERFLLAVDHTVDPEALAHNLRTQQLVEKARNFARESGMHHFYDANQTIIHTTFYRQLLAPGDLVLGADSHTTSHGGLGAFAIGLGGADVLAAALSGESWIEVPEAIAVEFVGEPPFGATGKDVILRTLGLLGCNAAALERSVEYRGDAAHRFSTDTRFTIANMTAELGGLNGVFEPDTVVADWLAGRPRPAALYFRADEGAPYVDRFSIALDHLAPQVARPFAPDNVAPVEEVAGQPLDGVFIGACTTTEEELVLAALVLEAGLAAGQRPRATPRRLVVPGDREIEERLAQRGLWAIYERAGFRLGPPGCSMCLGVASEKAQPGERWLSSQNRNYPNRMGSQSMAWLSSAATAASSAFNLEIADPRPLLAAVSRERYERLLGREPRHPAPAIGWSEPADATIPYARPATSPAATTHRILRGQVQRFGDHVDTDAIIPGEFCHLTTLEELGERCFHFQRPDFASKVRAGRNIVVAGHGWGTGSSREQAVWALQGAGVAAIVARSFAFIHRRNLVNQALPHFVVDDADFPLLVQEGDALEIDLAGVIRHLPSGREFQARPASTIGAALASEGGLIAALQRRGAGFFSRIGLGANAEGADN